MGRYVSIVLAALLILTGVLVLLPSSYVAAGGVVTNGDFEQGEDEVPYGWVITGNAVRVSTGPIYAGGWSALIDEDGAALTQWIENIEAVLNMRSGDGYMFPAMLPVSSLSTSGRGKREDS